MKKFLSMILCIAISLFAVACNGNGDNGNGGSGTTADGKVEIIVPAGWGGGAGTDYLKNIMNVFNNDPNWGNQPIGDYKGAVVKINEGLQNPDSVGKVQTIGADIFSTQHIKDVRFAENYLADITDIVKDSNIPGEDESIEDKIPAQYRDVFTSTSGKYIATPSTSLYCGYSIDTEMFEREQLYIAGAFVGSEEETVNTSFESFRSYYSSKFGIRLYFSEYDGDGLNKYGVGGQKSTQNGQIQTDRSDLSCGPDGVCGNNDDGLPSSVIEFLALCDYIRSNDFSEKARTTYYAPVALTGDKNRESYANSFLDGLYASLAGDLYEKCVQCFDSQGAKVRVVTGFTDQDLYPGISYIKKPIVQEVVITPETGYYVSWMEDKFYAEAALEILHHEDYFNYSEKSDVSYTDTHVNFLWGAYDDKNFREACAFLIEGSFWSMESNDYGAYDAIYRIDDNATNRRTEVAPMPVNINEPVTEGNGDQNTLVASTLNGLAINKKVESDPDKLAYCKLYLQFLQTEVVLAYQFNASQFDYLTLRDYEAVMDNPDNAEMINQLPFYVKYFNEYHFKRLGQLFANSRRVYGVGNLNGHINFRTNADYYSRLYLSGVFGQGKANAYATLRKDMAEGATIGQTIAYFEKTMMQKKDWDSMYSGYSSVDDSKKVYNGVVYTPYGA